MTACCGCCACFRPRYKRLVDSIFPADPNAGLVKANMDKLVFFAMKSPDKLDRIGEYLEQRLSRDIARQRYGYVNVSMDALDKLLVMCHAQALNLFVESYLKMVQKLLECNETDLQCLATSSFVKFANIEEDTPSYHRRYDFFVSKFSSMCHNSDRTAATRSRLRLAGLHGLQGVVRKTVTDDLQCNIWKPVHMDKIIPSLLFNMQDASFHCEPESPKDDDNPANVAETVFRDLICRASYGNINAVIRPVLVHLDNHSLWVPNGFAVGCFKVIMCAVQDQYGYIVVQMLMNHLDENSRKEAEIKASIIDVLSATVLIAAGGSIGPSVLEVFNTLLRHLRLSVENAPSSGPLAHDERHFQEAIVNTVGEFANNLPDYQKIEIMVFVMGKVPLPSESSQRTDTEVVLQTMQLKCLLKVATKYKTVLMSNAFPAAFLEPLLRMTLSRDPATRRIVQEILHTLLDRHNNLDKLKTVRLPSDIAELNLTVEKTPRQDVVFIKKNGSLFNWHIHETLQLSDNRVDNFETVYSTMVLLFLELGADEVILDIFRLALELQNTTVKSQLRITHKCALHALIAAYLNVVAQSISIPSLNEHIRSVIDARRTEACCYLPDVAFNRSNTSCRTSTSNCYPASDVMKDEWLFKADVIGEALSSTGHDVSRLSTPFVARLSALDTVDVSHSHSISDIQSLSLDTESASSTPTTGRRSQAEEVTFESLKRALEIDPKAEDQEKKHQQCIYESFRSRPFEEIVARSEANSQRFHNQLNEILDRISTPCDDVELTACNSDEDEGLSTSTQLTAARQQPLSSTSTTTDSVNVYDMQFPQLFVQ